MGGLEVRGLLIFNFLGLIVYKDVSGGIEESYVFWYLEIGRGYSYLGFE